MTQKHVDHSFQTMYFEVGLLVEQLFTVHYIACIDMKIEGFYSVMVIAFRFCVSLL